MEWVWYASLRMDNIIIAIVGMCGTGKSTAAKYIEKTFGFKSIYFGGYILKEVERRQLEINNRNEKIVREDLRNKYGFNVVAKMSLNDINGYLTAGCNVIIDGLYSLSEYLYLKEIFKDQLFIISIHSTKKIRYQRLGTREIRPLTPMEVDERDFFEIKNIEKAGPIAIADYHIINDSGIQGLYKRIKDILKGLDLKIRDKEAE